VFRAIIPVPLVVSLKIPNTVDFGITTGPSIGFRGFELRRRSPWN
jgi:hypothetical protein